MTGSGGVPCDRLPVPIVPCACCGFEPEQLRSHAWVPGHYLGDHVRLATISYLTRAVRVTLRRKHAVACRDRSNEYHGELGEEFAGRDPICRADDEPRLLMWVGRRFYSPATFSAESRELGISKRISEIPKGLVLGKTWVLLAHPDACYEPTSWSFNWLYGDGEVVPAPGIFEAFVPRRVELILHERDATAERVEREAKRGVSVVVIPDDAKDARISWRPGEAKPEIGQPAQSTLDVAPDPEETEAAGELDRREKEWAP